eukprot:716886-Pelagomonas_calceolata.AAC.1
MSLHGPIPSALYQYKLSGILCVNSACAHRARLTSPRAFHTSLSEGWLCSAILHLHTSLSEGPFFHTSLSE